MDRLHQIDEVLAEIDRATPILPFILPQNLAREKKKFFSRLFEYNPKFRYRNPHPKLGVFKKELRAMRPHTYGPELLFHKKHLELQDKMRLLEHVGTHRFTRYAIRLYGRPEEHLVLRSRKQLGKELLQPKNREMHLETRVIVRAIRTRLKRLRLRWRVLETTRQAARVAVDPKSKTIAVRKGSMFTKQELLSLLAHEIETHVFRAENGARQPFRLLHQGTAGYITTEEGLAIFNEREVIRKTKSPYHDQRLWLRVVAVDLALRCSFRHTFLALLKFGISPERAWETTLRVKRGLTITAKPGAFTRDYLYLKGYEMIKRYQKKKLKLASLYIGKVGVTDLPFLKDIPLRKPMRLPSYIA